MSQSGGDGEKLESGGDGDGRGKKGKGIGAADESDESSQVWSRIRGFTPSSEEDDTASTPAFDSLSSALESSLPMKRGLGGKTRSFGDLGNLPVDKNEVLKKEHPLNKRRRLLLAHEVYLDDNKTTAGGSSSANVAPAPLPPVDDQTNEEAAYDVKGEGPKTASDDEDDDDEI